MHRVLQVMAAVLLALPLTSNAQQSAIDFCGTVVLSINGVLTDLGEAQKNNYTLAQAHWDTHPDDPVLPDFIYAHNPSGKKYLWGAGGAVDFVEVMMQQTGLGLSRVLRMIGGIEAIPEDLAPIFNDVLSTAAVRGYNADGATLNTMLALVTTPVLEGKRVVVVAHSQGNLWANSVLSLVPSDLRRAVAQVGVGVPDSQLTKSPLPHVTLVEDFVIGPILFALPGNVKNGYSLAEIWDRVMGHNFVTAYMDARPSRGIILSFIDQTFAQLTKVPNTPDPCVSLKITKVTCEVVATDRKRWTIEGTAKSSTPLAVPVGGPSPSYGSSGGTVSACTAWSGVVVGRTVFQYCARNPSDPVTTGWTIRGDSPSSTNTVYVDLAVSRSSTVLTEPLTYLLPRVTKTGLSCPATHTFE